MMVNASPSTTFCQDQLERAEALLAKNERLKAKAILEEVVSHETLGADDVDEIRAKEQAIYALTGLLVASSDGESLIALLTRTRSFFSLLPKAKATRMVRKVFESIVLCGVPLSQQQVVCVETIQWARQEKRTFLRHRLQLRLAEVQFEQRDSRTALLTLIALLREVRRLDDRTLLLEIHLLESKIYYSIKNTSKARAALVSARTTANSIYCPPLAQAEIDLQSGVLHAEERDYKTAYSYLFEAFEGFHQLGNQAQLARKALHYMIISKTLSDNADELTAVLASKNVLEYSGEDMDTLRGIADAYMKRDTHRFNDVLSKGTAAATAATEQGVTDSSAASLLRDEVVGRQLHEMYDMLVERHLLKVIQPYNRVQVSFLAKLLKLDEESVESRISQLILDKKLSGIVDQQHACLIVFDEVERNKKGSAGGPNGGNANAGGGEKVYENAADQAAAEAQEKTTLHQDALVALERYDALVTALFDKVAGKFDTLVQDRLAKRQLKEKEKLDRKKKGEGKEENADGNAKNGANAASGDGASKKD